jgi:small subunit ribosomal protein S8
MSVSDPIADALTKIRNAYRAGHTQVVLNHSRFLEESYVNNYQVMEKDPDQRINYRRIHVNLRYTNTGVPVLKGIQKITKPGRRMYVKADKLPSVYNNTGCAIISTSIGVMADRDARKNRVGGEYICKVW